MSAQYSYDYPIQKSTYTTLQDVSTYKIQANCFAPSSFINSRSQRDIDDYNTYVLNKQTTENYSYCNDCGCNNKKLLPQKKKNTKENFCNCSGSPACPTKFQCQNFNRNVQQIEQDYVNGKYTENNFVQR